MENIKKMISDINVIISLIEIECCFISDDNELNDTFNEICKLNDFITLVLFKMNKYNIN